jgi:hypothetical protein
MIIKMKPEAGKAVKLLTGFLLLLLSSCLKEEDPVTPPDFLGDVETATIPMGKNYEKQFFFDLGTNQIVASNYRSEWDLAFECGAEGHHILLNTSKLMFAWNTGITDFYAVTSADSAQWKWDVASGNLDSTAIGQWGTYADGNVTSFRNIYLINLGKDPFGNSYGIRKIDFGELKNNTYRLKFANLDGSDEHIFEIKKNNDYSFMYFSFANGGELKTIAPKKNEWDLVFTVYTHIFSETPDNIQQPDTLIPYTVTGVLLNRAGVAAALITGVPFQEIGLEQAMAVPLDEKNIDVIGYNWKLFNFNAVTYEVLPDKIYIIRDSEGYLYKMRFIDFYQSGEKGYPKFEFQRL